MTYKIDEAQKINPPSPKRLTYANRNNVTKIGFFPNL